MEKRRTVKLQVSLEISYLSIAVAIIALLGILAYWMVSNVELEKDTRPGLADISTIIGVPLNHYESCWLWSSIHHHRRQSNMLLAKAYISRPDAWRLFAKYDDNPLSREDRNGMTDHMYGLERDVNGWDPDSVYESRTFTINHRGWTTITIGLDRRDMAVLYIYWWSP